MNKIYRNVFLGLAALSASNAVADGGDQLTVVTTAGNKSYATEEIKRIDLNDEGIMVVTSDESGDTYAFAELQEILFVGSSATAVPQVLTRQSKTLTLFVSRDGSTLQVNGWQADPTKVELFDASGTKLLEIGRWSGEAVDISRLHHGTYIIKLSDKTAKFVK